MTAKGQTLLIGLSIPTTFIVNAFERFVFNDWQFLWFLIVLIGLDTIVGIMKHIKLKKISADGFGKFFTKIGIYAAVLVLTHVVKSFEISGEKNMFFEWIDDFMYSAIVVKEAISILTSIAIIKPNVLPKWILRRFEAFDDSGNFNDLTNNTINNE